MRKLSFLLYVFTLTVLFSGCKSDDGLTIDNFKTTAVVKGNVYYSLGQDFVDNKYLIDKIVNAAGKTIYLDVPNSDYKPGAIGVVTYSAVIDESGNYEFAVPIKAQGTAAGTIRMEPFVAERKVYEGMDAGSPVYKSEEALFSYNGTVNLSNGSLAVKNFSYTYTPVAIPETYNDYILFEGTLELAYEKGYRDGAFKAAAGKNVEVSVGYPELGTNLHFGATTDQSGKYQIEIPVKSKKNAVTAEFIPVSFIAGDYVHYTSAAEQKNLSGIYSTTAKTITTKQGFTENISYEVDKATMFFTPSTLPDTWSLNLAGWVQLDTEIYKYPVTLTGGIFIAYEKSYLTGDYNPAANKSVTVALDMGGNFGSQTYLLATNSNGTFSLPVILPAKNTNITVSVETEDYSVDNYTHYLSDGTSVLLKGWYKSNYYNINNSPVSINEFTSTYAIDNLYRQFTPFGTVQEWDSNLFGWYRTAGEKGSITITGGIKKAVEGAPDTSKPNEWQVATWAIAANQPFSITISGAGTLKGITNNTGQYTLSLPVNTDPALINSRTIALSSIIEKVTDFKHYDKIDAAAATIQGSYSGTISFTQFEVIDGALTVKDCYMFFTPTTIPTGWYGYNWTIPND